MGVQGRAAQVMARAREVLVAHYDDWRSAINTDLAAASPTAYQLPLLTPAQIRVRAQVPTGSREGTQLRLVLVNHQVTPATAEGQATGLVTLDLCSVLVVSDASPHAELDAEEVTMRAVYDLLEAARRCLSAHAPEQPLSLMGSASRVYALTSTTTRHELYRRDGTSGLFTGAMATARLTLRQRGEL
jgi:hypothetical protein